ncbi:MAG TPA: fused response regulator/phosphatase [Desulfobacterales bacterium]|nr:fused response regulator/phosphatase [Desulfobacterales bacterium]
MKNLVKKTTVLIVDNNRGKRLLINTYLREGGYGVVEAADGETGFEACLQQSIDLILLDIGMLGMGGFSLCDKLQNDEQFQSIPVIILSSNGDIETRVRAFELGSADYIVEPVAKSELLIRIRTRLANSRLLDSLQKTNKELLKKQQQQMQDLHAAADFQQHLLPNPVHECKTLHFAPYFKPSREVGGDIYNIQRLDDEHLAIYILDVSGHGFAAGMMTLLATQALSGSTSITKKLNPDGEVESVSSPKEVVMALNAEFPLTRFNCYMTIVYLLYNTRKHSFRYCCAGHPPLIHITKTGAMTFLDAGGPPAGMDGSWNEGEGFLDSGDRLFFYTDGFTGYMNEAGEFYGQQRFFGSILSSGRFSLQASVQSIVEELKQFGSKLDGDDDMTLLAVERK